jgi:hypothetical protein
MHHHNAARSHPQAVKVIDDLGSSDWDCGGQLLSLALIELLEGKDIVHMMIWHTQRPISPLTVVADDGEGVGEASRGDDGGIGQFELSLPTDVGRFNRMLLVVVEVPHSRQCKQASVDRCDALDVALTCRACRDLGEGDGGDNDRKVWMQEQGTQ